MIKDKELNNVYEGQTTDKTMYSCYLKKTVKHEILLDFKTTQIIPNNHGKPKGSISINARIKKTTYYNGQEYKNFETTMIFPKITFALACKEAGIDLRSEEGVCLITLIIKTRRKYEIKEVIRHI